MHGGLLRFRGWRLFPSNRRVMCTHLLLDRHFWHKMFVKKQPLSTFIIDDFYHFHSCEIQGKSHPFATQLSTCLFLFLCWCMTNAPSCLLSLVQVLSVDVLPSSELSISGFSVIINLLICSHFGSWLFSSKLLASLNNPQFISVILITTKWPALQMQSLSRERKKENIHTLLIVGTSSRLIS